MVLRADAGCVATGDDGAAGNGTNGSAGEGIVESNTDSSETLHIWHGGSTFAIMPQPFGGVILADNPDDIGLFLFGLGRDRENEDGEEKSGDSHNYCVEGGP